MQFFTLFTLLLCTHFAHAAPLVGFNTIGSANLYQIKNAKKEIIFSATADTVKRVELRDGLAVVQTSSNNVSLIREDGKILVDAVFGSELLVSHKLLAIYTPNGIASIYSLDGTKIFPAADESQTRPVREVHIANDRFAVVDRNTNLLSIHDAEGKGVFTSNDTALVMISDGFLAIKSAAGTLSLYNADLDLITTDSGMSNVQISDEFAGYTDYNGNLRLFSTEGEFPAMMNVSKVTLTNTFAMVTDNVGTTVYGKDKSVLETPSKRKEFSASHALFAEVSNTNALTVKNEETEQSFVVSGMTGTYSMSDDLLVVRNGMGDFAVYSLKGDSFGRLAYRTLNQSIATYQAGNGVVAFLTTLQSGASNSAQVLGFNGTEKSVLVDESPVTKVDLTVNREELNWK